MKVQKQWLMGATLAALAWAGTANAATFVVDRTDDTAAATACTAAANDCSLRGAVITANAAAGADIITLPAGVYTLSIPNTVICENAAATGDLDIINGASGSDVTINGSTSGASIIDGGGIDTVFHVPAITFASSLTLNNLTVRNGNALGCTAGDSHGGGIRSDQGNVTLNSVTVSGSDAGDAGGGIYMGAGSLVAINSTISGNTANNGAGLAAPTLGDIDLRNVTIAGNTAAGDGGGVNMIADNTTFTIRNTIIAGNTDSSTGNNPDCANPQNATIVSEGFNLIGNTTGCTIGAASGDQIGTSGTPINPQIGPLANNGGPTQTHALLTGSTAIDGGNTAGCFANAANNGSLLTSDERGELRPVDGDADSTPRCDIGAFELQVPACGDGNLDAGEECDDGNVVDNDGCSANCTNETPTTLPSCGDGVQDALEQCDDGNTMDGDGCSSTCATEGKACGDGLLNGSEVCDDGNTVDGDGCSATCTVETGYSCTDNVNEISICTPGCGDGVINGSEECDDGNSVDGDGCSAICDVDDGFGCVGSPSVCAPLGGDCGDGNLDGGEECDDGNTVGGDGCSAACGIEAGFACTTEAGDKSECAAGCGNGEPLSPEECDDGNNVTGDGCSSTCRVETTTYCSTNPANCLFLLLGDGGCGLVKADTSEDFSVLTMILLMSSAVLVTLRLQRRI